MTSYLGITIHYLNNKFLASSNLETINLSERHTAEYIQDKLKSVIQDWGLDINEVTAIIQLDYYLMI